ncbi:MAG TPA: hypothetical protein VEY12_01770 [Thermoplasmata archaeon]|nr:hypothetical protein [Thermoplasmata archaeon]
MSTKGRMLIAGTTLIAASMIALLAIAAAYWPLQTVVQVVSPFLGVSILASVGLSLVLTSLLLPKAPTRRRQDSEAMSALDSLLSETKRRP